MMATSDEGIESMDCPVCHEKYSDPKILPCAHLLCRKCLLNWIKTKKEELCPLCRSVIVDPKHSDFKMLDKFVESLPTDPVMSEMIESLKILSEKHVCHAHNNVDAISMCLHCSVKLCQSCIEVHREIQLTRFHKIEKLATLTPQRLAASRQAPCSVHRDKTAELVCVDHNVFICQLCATTKHRACSEVKDVSEMSGNYKQTLLKMENKLRAAESSLSQAITKLEERLLNAEKITNDALAEIDKTCDSLVKSVETCRTRLKKLLNDENVKLKDVVHEQKNILYHKRVRVTSHQGLIKRVLQMENGEILVAMVNNLEGRVNDLSTPLSQDTHACLTVTLKIDMDSISLMNEKLKKIIEPIFNFTRGTEENTWMFHNNSGNNIVLSSNGQTAEVEDNNEKKCRVLISKEPLSTNKLYEILVEETDIQWDMANTFIGVCKENPSLIIMPIDCSEVKTFIGVHAFGSIRHCHKDYVHSCPALKNVKMGSRLGVMVDTSHSLHVYVDGKDQGIMAKNVAQPCYAMFDLQHFLKKVSTLPVSSVQ